MFYLFKILNFPLNLSYLSHEELGQIRCGFYQTIKNILVPPGEYLGVNYLDVIVQKNFWFLSHVNDSFPPSSVCTP